VLKRKTNMKTTLITLLAGITLFSFTGLTQAQYAATGSDGIIASPKYRQVLDERKTSVPTAAKAMACPKCRNEVTKQTDRTARGANKPAVTVVKHLCESCNTTRTATGHGKAAKTDVQHACAAAEIAGTACCRTGS
jgi:hypothetical protein